MPDLPDFYEANLALLRKHHPRAWEMITTSASDPAGELFLSPGGKPNIRLKGREGNWQELHATDDPEIETSQFLNMVPESSAGVVLLLGMGLGYTLRAVLRERSEIRYLVLFERDPGIFRRALQALDLSSTLPDSRLILCFSPDAEEISEALAPAARVLQLESIHTLNHLPCFAADPEGYQKLADMVFTCANSFNVGGQTKLHFGASFTANRFKQLASIHHDHLLESLRDVFPDVPAIIVAGGPSLDKNIHRLRSAKGKAVIIAVDTVLPALLAHGVTPDFVTSIDPQDITYEKIGSAAPDVRDISLVCMPWVAPKVPKMFPTTGVFWAFTANHIESWMNRLLGGDILTGGAGTVAHLNMTTALMLGCSPVIFVGQDLAYTGFKDHADHTVLTAEGELSKLMNSPELQWVDGIDGEKVPTSRGFFSDKRHFEAVIKSNPGHYINATEGGAHIEGTEVMTLEAALHEHCQGSLDIGEMIRSNRNRIDLSDTRKLTTEFRSLLKQVRQVEKTISKTDGISRSVVEKLRKLSVSGGYYPAFNALPKPLQQGINRIDSLHKKLDGTKKIWTLLDDLTLHGVQQTDRMRHRIDQLEGKPEKYLEWMTENLNRLDAINRVRVDVLTLFKGHLREILEHIDKESGLLGKTDGNELLQLARLYFESGHLALARPVLEQLATAMPDSGEVQYYLGAIAAHHSAFDAVRKRFARAKEMDPGISVKIDLFSRQMGDRYLQYGKESITDRHPLAMFGKGLRYCKNHPDLSEAIVTLLHSDLAKIEAGRDEGASTDAAREAGTLIKRWQTALQGDDVPGALIDDRSAAAIYQHHGNLVRDEGDLSGAIASFTKALDFSPENASLHLAVTDACFFMGDFDLGIRHLREAVLRDKNCATYWESLGDRLRENGQAADAAAAYEQCFMALPDNFELLKKIGECYLSAGEVEAAREALRHYKAQLLEKGAAGQKPGTDEAPGYDAARLEQEMESARQLFNAGRPEEAANICQRVLELNPRHAEALYLSGHIDFQRGRYEPAAALARRAVDAEGGNPDYFQLLGDALQLSGDLAAAVKSYEKALQLSPDHCNARHNMGKALLDGGKVAPAITCFEKVLELAPDHADACFNLGIARQGERNLPEASRLYERALALRPDFGGALNNLALVTQSMGELERAAALFGKLIAMHPDFIDAHNNLGTIFQDMGKIEEAIACYQKVLAIRPDSPHALNNLIDQMQYACDWADLPRLLERSAEETRKSLLGGKCPEEKPFSSLMRYADPSHNLAVAKAYANKGPYADGNFTFEGEGRHNGKLRVGYLSNNFNSHAVGHILSSLFKHHDPSAIEVYGYSFGPDDGSVFRKNIEGACDSFTDIRHLTDAEAARRINGDGIDILVEMNGYTHGGRLGICALRPAPIQISYLGFLGSTGADFIDYIITDQTVTPESQAPFYSENFIYMPHCYQVTDYSDHAPSRTWEKKDFGLPDSGAIFCSFNQPYKFDPEMFDVWMKILAQVPTSVLWLMKTSELNRRNLRQEAGKRGIAPDRLVFSAPLPLGDHLERMRIADIALDTRIYNGGATTSNALWAGVPVITLQGASYVSRMSSSSLSAIGLSDLITRDLAAYEALAVDLANAPDWLMTLKRQLAESRSRATIFDSRGYVQDLESALQSVWEIHRAGEAPRQITVDPASL